MGRYILRRILYAIPIAFGVSVVCFSLVYIAPGDPLQTVLPPDATAETIAIVKHAWIIWLPSTPSTAGPSSRASTTRGRAPGCVEVRRRRGSLAAVSSDRRSPL